MKSASLAKASALIGVVIAFGWPLLVAATGISTHRITSVHDDTVVVWNEWLVVAILCVFAFAIQRRRPSEFGIRRMGWRDVLAGLGAAIVGFVLTGVATRVVVFPSSLTDPQKLAAVPLGLRVAVVLTAALCEEFIYRGFGIEELAFLTGKRWLAGLISLVLFTFSHAGLYGLSLALIVPGILGAVLTVLYLWRNNLFSCAIMHAIIDGIMILIIPAVIHTR